MDCFNQVASYFMQNFCVHLVDFEGFGKSKEPKQAKTVADYANDVINLICEKDMKDLIIIGHSFGGRVAIEIASRYPNLVKKLVLVDSAGLKPHRKPSYFIKIWLYKIKKTLNLDISKCGSSDYKVLSPIMQKTFYNVVNYYQDSLLKAINAKTLIIFGKNDRETPIYMAKKLNKNIKNSKLILFDNCGHFPFLEDTYNFIRVVENFIDE